MDIEIWVVGTLNQLFIKDFYTEIELNLLPILFALTLAFDRTVLYGKVGFSILVLSCKKSTPVFK